MKLIFIKMREFLIENIYAMFGWRVCQQIVS